MMTRLSAVLFILSVLFALPSFAQEGDDASTMGGKVDGLTERTATLESTVDKLNKLKITGYIQPQWVWGDVDSQGNQFANRNYFTIRRGRIKFQHSTGDVTYVLYPDITERGVEMKEVWASWQMIPELSMTLGAMNRPFGYEIGYSSSSREIAERSIAEQRLFNGERDLGLQLGITPKIMKGFTPTIELGLFNGSDNFGQGPVSAVPGSNKLGFTYAQIIGPDVRTRFRTATGPDSTLQAMINKGVGRDSLFSNLTSDAGYKVNQKELLGHVRLPFLVSDEFSFDIGGSWSIGGIAEPTDLIGEYTGTNGALVLTKTGTQSDATFSAGDTRSGLFFSNRTVFGADAQFYLSVLPFGGTILKTEMYTGQVPFYGSSALFTAADTAALGAPRTSTILKNVFGFYAMLVQNISDDYQVALRYDSYDPNTSVKGTDFAFQNGTSVSSLRGVAAGTSFGQDLAISTLSVAFNAYISGNIRMMLNYDHPVTEEYTRNRGGLQTVSDANDDRFTARMQYKF
jgi:hypothetical protein